MKIQAFKTAGGVLLGLSLWLGWHGYALSRQVQMAGLIDYQCRKTQEMFDARLDAQQLAMRLDFLMGYHEEYAKPLVGSPLAGMVEQIYQLTLSNAVAAFRQRSTNDLGNDPRVWIKKYEP